MKTFEELNEIVKTRLSEKRYRHTIGVVDAAQKLAERYGADVAVARLAGFLHDITKEDSYEQQLKYCDRFGIILNNGEKQIPKLLHAYTGAYYAKNILGIENQEVITAIYYHTTGKANMSLLDKIVYLADYIEINRVFDGVEKVREVAFDNIDKALLIGIVQGIEEVIQKGSMVHIDSLNCYNWLINLKE